MRFINCVLYMLIVFFAIAMTLSYMLGFISDNDLVVFVIITSTLMVIVDKIKERLERCVK